MASGPCILRAGKRHIEVPNENEHEGSLPNKSSRIFTLGLGNESNEMNRRQYESLATQYSRLAERADRNDNQTSAPTAATQNGPRANLE
jgi:hypothetical protein